MPTDHTFDVVSTSVITISFSYIEIHKSAQSSTEGLTNMPKPAVAIVF